jgi:hypothetical protein
MGNPALARSDEEGRRFYTFGDPPESFWSVTTIISGGLPKHLQAHYAKMAAELAYESILARGPHSRAGAIVRRLAALGRANIIERQARGELKTIRLEKQSERDLALRWLKGAADRHRDAAAERGSAVHAEAEQLVLAHARESSRLFLEHERVAPWPAELAAYQRSFTNWLDDYHPEFLAAEATVFNRTQAYAGTLDTIVRVELPSGVVITPVVDFKTGKAIYPEVALQLAPYARGEFIGHPDGVTELPMPTVDSGAVLHLTPNGYQFRLVRIDQEIYEAFLFVRESYRFAIDLAKTVLLQDLTVVRVAEEVA